MLRSIGVRVSALPLPEAAASLLDTSRSRALKPDEVAKLLSTFSLHRGELLAEISKAGREPEAHRGGYLSTSEIGVPPYPKVYDMKALTPEVMAYLQVKFGKLHVNSADNGMGVDEIMSLVSGGPWTWFFLLPDDVIGKLTLGSVGLEGPGWRISYPGLVPHGAYLESEYGLIVAHIHGPKNFVMRYEEPSVSGAKILGTNSWIDFSGKTPRLLDIASTPAKKSP
ncbi:MAG: hypothetical protein L3J04_07030 [Robiginitomaculum sp.]|nr:hypothetical protein [Robiginitomaculum sp.]